MRWPSLPATDGPPSPAPAEPGRGWGPGGGAAARRWLLALCVLGVALLRGWRVSAHTVPEPKAPEAVALYLFGQPRSLRRTLCSLHRHVVRPLQQRWSRVYVYAVIERDAQVGDSALLHRLPGVVVRLRVLNVSEAAAAVPEACVAAVRRGYSRATLRAYGEDYPREWLRQLYYRWLCDQWRQEDEVKGVDTIAWVLFGRLDVVYLHPLFHLGSLVPGVVYSPRWRGYRGLNDEWAVASPTAATHYSELYRDLCHGGLAQALARRPRDNLNSEMIHAWHLDRRQVPTRCLREPGRRFWFARLRVAEPAPFAPDMRIASYFAGKAVCTNEAVMTQQLAKRAGQLLCNGTLVKPQPLTTVEECHPFKGGAKSVYQDWSTKCSNRWRQPPPSTGPTVLRGGNLSRPPAAP
eukprot:EG_transcript_12271